MTTVRYEGGIPRVLHDEIAEQTSTTVALATYSTPTVLCNASSNPITVTLPVASTCEGVMFTVKKTDSSTNIVTISRSGSDLIDGATSHTISQQYVTLAVQSDGSNWYIVSLDRDYELLQAEVTARMDADSTLASMISGGNVYEITSNGNAAAGDVIFADTTSGPITITLPASPTIGDRVRIMDPKSIWDSTNKVIVGRNGNKIEGYTSDLELTVPGDSVDLVFYSTTSDWRINY